MKYPIDILKAQALRHLLKIQELENIDHDMYASIVMIDEEIDQHKKHIEEINEAILLLIKN